MIILLTTNLVEPYQFKPEYDSDELTDIPDEEIAPEASEMHTTKRLLAGVSAEAIA